MSSQPIRIMEVVFPLESIFDLVLVVLFIESVIICYSLFIKKEGKAIRTHLWRDSEQI